MNATDLIRLAFQGVHHELLADLQTVDESQLFARPAPGMNHAGFLFWHLVRDEDLVVHHVCGGPTLWEAEGWIERFGFETEEQGTGFEVERATGVRYSLAEFTRYAERVWEATDQLLRSQSEESLERKLDIGNWTAVQLLLDGCLGHNWVHLGEMRYALGLQAWKYRE